MRFTDIIFASLSLVAAVRGQTGSSGQVKVHVVKVGWNGQLSFSPENIQANPGEMVQFQYYPKVFSDFSGVGEPYS
jgi:plastocyanin